MRKLYALGLLLVLTSVSSFAQSLFDITLKEAMAGDSKAQNNLAAYYKEGYGVQQDCSKAVYWYRKSVQQNDPVGMYGLGQCYATGCGVPQDLSMAARYILGAAQKGLKEAQQTIAYMYEHGIGVVQNSASANYWYNQANK